MLCPHSIDARFFSGKDMQLLRFALVCARLLRELESGFILAVQFHMRIEGFARLAFKSLYERRFTFCQQVGQLAVG